MHRVERYCDERSAVKAPLSPSTQRVSAPASQTRNVASLASFFTRTVDSDDPVHHFARLNLSGLDYKGQTSTGYGRSGFSLELSVTFDLGTFFGPGLVTLEAGITGTGQRSHHTLMVCHRFPTRIYNSSVLHLSVSSSPKPGEAPTPARAGITPRWRGSRPLVLGILHGVAWEGTLAVSASAELAPVDPVECDELGLSAELSAGASVTAEGHVRLLSLVDRHARTFGPLAAATVYDGSLAAAVDEELVGDVKARVAAWVIEVSGIKSSKAGDLLTEQLSTESILDEIAPDLATWSGTTSGGSDWEADGRAELIRTVDLLRKGRTPSTEAVLAQLATLRTKLVTDKRTDDLAILDGFADALRQRKAAKTAASKAQGGFLDFALGRRGASTTPVAAATPTGPATLVRLSSRQFRGNATVTASAGTEVVHQALGVDAQASLEYLRRRTKFRFQVVGEETRHGQVVMTQDTVVTHNTFTAAASLEAKASAMEFARDGEKVYGTITYRSATAYWLAPKPMAYPNGSGVSFGLSIDPDRLCAYAVWCRGAGKPAGATSAAAPTGAEAKVENYLTEQLRVSAAQLREYFAEFAYEPGEIDRPVLVEASFALTAAQSLTMAPATTPPAPEPAELFGLKPVAARLASKASAQTDGSELQALRVRCPLGAAEDNTRSLFSFGLTVAVGLGAKLDRVDRVGAQGMFDLHARFFPDLLRAKDDEQRQRREARYAAQRHDLAVPPVVLLGESS